MEFLLRVRRILSYGLDAHLRYDLAPGFNVQVRNVYAQSSIVKNGHLGRQCRLYMDYATLTLLLNKSQPDLFRNKSKLRHLHVDSDFL